jgi:hypothetical protein
MIAGRFRWRPPIASIPGKVGLLVTCPLQPLHG